MRKTVSRIILITLLMGMLTLAFNLQPVKASGTIYIRANGSVDGTTSIQTGDNVTYVFTANINDPIVVQRNNIIIDGKGYTLQGAWNGTGIDLSIRTNATVQNATIKAFNYGIGLSSSSNNNTISGNNITANIENGILLDQSLNNMISGNNITANNRFGIWLYGPSNTTVSGNNIANNTYGIELGYSSNNAISGNNITANNVFDIELESASHNVIYHNNFIDNQQVNSSTSMNVWDDGYPSGGNYWSDYVGGVDEKSGPNQDQPGGDGIGDNPYLIDANNRD